MGQRIRPIAREGSRPRVLVIDDEPEMCKCLERCLQLLDCEAQSSTSGPQGLSRLEREKYDLVFTDLRMPGMNGIEVVRAVRRIGRASCRERV